MDLASILISGLLPILPLLMLVLSAVLAVKAFKLYAPIITGWLGEKEVQAVLKGLDPRKYTCFHDVLLPIDGETTQIDHIVFAGEKCFVIETKAHAGWIFGSEHENNWTQMLSRRSEFKFQNPVRQNYKHLLAVRNFVGELSTIGVVVFTRGTFKNDRIENVLYTKELKLFLLNNPVAESFNNEMAVQSFMGAMILERREHQAHVRRLQGKYGGRWRIRIAHSLMIAAVCLLIFRPGVEAAVKVPAPIALSSTPVQSAHYTNRTAPKAYTASQESSGAVHEDKPDERLFIPSVNGFMNGKAVVKNTKGFQVLKVGDVTSEGWKLVKADSSSATFEHALGKIAKVAAR